MPRVRNLLRACEYTYLYCGYFCARTDQKAPEAVNLIEQTERSELRAITKVSGETVATASTFENLSFYIHTEEATGSIPVSPTILSSLTTSYLLRKVDFSCNERTPRILDRNEGVGYTSDYLCNVSGLNVK
jgi:hypothetical protein